VGKEVAWKAQNRQSRKLAIKLGAGLSYSGKRTIYPN